VEGRGFAVLAGSVGEPSLSIIEAAPDRQPGLHHVNVDVAGTDELERGLQAMSQAGISAASSGAAERGGAVYLSDPTGLLVKMHVAGSVDVERLSTMDASEALYAL
jgi:catechol-2,3-dioxygenase